MKNVSNTQLVEMFQVEELEERLENKWTPTCGWVAKSYTDLVDPANNSVSLVWECSWN